MPISSLTDVANYALNNLNAGSIMSIDENGRVAGICKKYIDLAFFQALSDGEFSSTRRRKTLQLRTDLSRPDYQYCYYLPTNYVKALSLESGADFEIEALALFTNDVDPVLLYIEKLQNLGQYQPFVLDVVALTLATLICVEIKADANLLIIANANLKQMTKRAKIHDRSERNGQKSRPKSWTDWQTAVDDW